MPSAANLRRRPTVLLALAVLAVFVVPGPVAGTFNGAPWSHPHEATLVGLVALALFVTPARRRLSAELANVGSRVRLLPWLFTVLAFMKLLAFAAAPAGGFLDGCYRGGVEPQIEKCAVSFENPWNRGGVTRFDRAIDFGPTESNGTTISQSNWNLGHVNELIFNVYTVEGNVDMERFPFHATWTGEVDVSASELVALRYVGEGSVTLGEVTTPLPASYTTENSVSLTVGQGRHDLTLDFAFTSTVLTGEIPEGSYAALKVTGLAPASAPLIVTLLIWLVDLLMYGLMVVLVGLLVLTLRPWLLAIAAAVATWGATQLVVVADMAPELVRGLVPLAGVVGAIGLVVVAARRPQQVVAWGTTFAVLLAISRTMDLLGSWSKVL